MEGQSNEPSPTLPTIRLNHEEVSAVLSRFWRLGASASNAERSARFVADLEPCLVGMEASGSAHPWAQVLSGAGHTVKLMAPQFAKPYVKSNKNDASDAEAICEAVARANMHYVPLKSIAQQDLQCLHRARSRLVACRTQLHPNVKRNIDFLKIFLR
jgi:transposase